MAKAPKDSNPLWIAEIELEASHTRIQAFGATPEECLRALIEAGTVSGARPAVRRQLTWPVDDN
jgi:hypothetical protein